MSEKAMAPHSSTLAWRIPWTEEAGGLQSMGSLLVGHDWSDFTFTFHFHALEKEMATRSSVLAWRILGTGEPGGLPSMGSHRVGHDWSDLAVALRSKGPELLIIVLKECPLLSTLETWLFTTLQPFPSKSCFSLYSGTWILLLRYPMFKVCISPI